MSEAKAERELPAMSAAPLGVKSKDLLLSRLAGVSEAGVPLASQRLLGAPTPDARKKHCLSRSGFVVN